jgi:Fe-S cluster biogenesis protein NfuA
VTDDMVVKVKLMGACSSCNVSMMTMKSGVEQAIKRAAPEIKEVIDITSL